MARVKTTINLMFGRNAKYNGWGLVSCSHGMYSSGGYNFYVYGIQGLISLEIDKRWEKFIKNI